MPVKDVGWALDVLDGLRARDPGWRLLLVGGGLGDVLTAGSWTYKEATEKRIAAAEATGRWSGWASGTTSPRCSPTSA